MTLFVITTAEPSTASQAGDAGSTPVARSRLPGKRAAEVFNDEGLRSSTDNVGEFLKRFWTPGQSEYLRGKATEGREVSPDYAANSKALIEH